MFLGDARFGFDGGKHSSQVFVRLGIIFSTVGDERLTRDFRQTDRAPLGQGMIGCDRETE